MNKNVNLKIVWILATAFVIAGCASGPELGTTTPLQSTLNAMPAISINGESLKFEFGGNKWIARANGENHSAGTLETENTNDGYILTLKQTHAWRVANVGEKTLGIMDRAVGGTLMVATGSIPASAVAESREAENQKSWRKTSGQDIILEYISGPPENLSVK